MKHRRTAEDVKTDVLLGAVWSRSCWAQVEMIRGYFHHRRQCDRKTDGYLALHPSFPPCSDGCSCLSDIPGPERGGRRLADTKTPPGSDTVIILISNRSHRVDALDIESNQFMQISYPLCVSLFNCTAETCTSLQ